MPSRIGNAVEIAWNRATGLEPAGAAAGFLGAQVVYEVATPPSPPTSPKHALHEFGEVGVGVLGAFAAVATIALIRQWRSASPNSESSTEDIDRAGGY